jgi:ribosomal protein S18 acetylase RimI-like enzyme
MSQPDDELAIRPRQATIGDLPSIERLNAAAYAVYRDRMNRPPAPVVHDYTPEVEAGMAWLIGEPGEPSERGEPCEPGEQPAGVIVLIPAGDSLLIENIAVAPAAQGRGLGRQLMEFAERQAAARGFRLLTLYTNEVMEENIAIYTSLGYRETARRLVDGYQRVYMEKRLYPAS